jgi:hypothetical protein
MTMLREFDTIVISLYKSPDGTGIEISVRSRNLPKVTENRAGIQTQSPQQDLTGALAPCTWMPMSQSTADLTMLEMKLLLGALAQ